MSNPVTNPAVERVMGMVYGLHHRVDQMIRYHEDGDRKRYVIARERQEKEDEALRAEIAAMVEALEFYASHDNWEEDGVASLADCDEGDRARQALSPLRGKTTEGGGA